MRETVRSTIDDWLFLLRDLSPRREVLAALLILSETMIVYIFAGTLLAELHAPYAPLPVVLIFMVLLFGRLVPHLLTTLRVWTPQYESIMTISIVLTMVLLIYAGAFPGESLFSTAWLQGTLDALILRDSDASRSVWLLVAFVALAWWRGKTRAEPNLETSYTMLRLGMIWIAGGLVFTVLAAPDGARILDHIPAAIAGFIVFTLIAIAVARQPEAGQSAAWKMSPVWLLVLVLPVLLIAGTSITTVGLFSRETLDLLLIAVSPVLLLLQFLVQALVLTIALIAFIIISPVIWLLERQGFGPIDGFPSIDLSPGSGLEADDAGNTILQVEDPARYLIVGVIMLALLWFLVRFVFRRRKEWQADAFQQSESLIAWSPDPAEMANRLGSWVRRHLRRQVDPIGPVGNEWAATRRIRRLYRSFLIENRKAGIDRESGETPSAYARRVGEIYGARRREIDLVTTTYNRARYSGIPAESTDADSAEVALNMFRKPES